MTLIEIRVGADISSPRSRNDGGRGLGLVRIGAVHDIDVGVGSQSVLSGLQIAVSRPESGRDAGGIVGALVATVIGVDGGSLLVAGTIAIGPAGHIAGASLDLPGTRHTRVLADNGVDLRVGGVLSDGQFQVAVSVGRVPLSDDAGGIGRAGLGTALTSRLQDGTLVASGHVGLAAHLADLVARLEVSVDARVALHNGLQW